MPELYVPSHLVSDRIPRDIERAVVQWYAERGRSAVMKWHRFFNCPLIELELKPDDPRLRAWQENKVPEKPTESILLNRREGGRLVPIKLEEFGPSGIVGLLEKIDLLSGTGEFRDLMHAIEATHEHNRQLKRLAIRENAERSFENMKDPKYSTERNFLVTENIGAADA